MIAKHEIIPDTIIYFIRGELTGLIKIGMAHDVCPCARLKTLQIGSPDKLVCLGFQNRTKSDERVLHKRFKAIREHGEWFKPSDELFNYIAQNATFKCEHPIRAKHKKQLRSPVREKRTKPSYAQYSWRVTRHAELFDKHGTMGGIDVKG